MNAGLERAVELMGGPSALADALGTTVQVVTNWRRRGSVPAERVIEVARATAWTVTPNDLSRELYPNRDDGMPEERRHRPDEGRAAA